MPQIRPSSDLRNKYAEISEFCHRYEEPIYITKNGAGDLAVMSIETYERIVGKFELYSLLEAGLEDVRQGRIEPAHEAINEIRAELNNETV